MCAATAATDRCEMSGSLAALPGARTTAGAAVLDELPHGWAELYRQATGRPLRHAQACILSEVARGHDVVGIAATGSGKGSIWNLVAAVERRALLDGPMPTRLAPVHLVVTPLAALGEAHEAESCDFLHDACAEHVPPPVDGQPRCFLPRGLNVSRSGRALDEPVASDAALPSMPVCERGHPLAVCCGRDDRRGGLAVCDVPGCGADIGKNEARAQCRQGLGSSTPCDFDMCMTCYRELSARAVAAAATLATPQPASPSPPKPNAGQPPPLPTGLPCGVCDACVDPAYPPDKKAKYPLGCRWTCRVWWPGVEHRSAWCAPCQRGDSCQRCKKRADLARGQVPTSTPPDAGSSTDRIDSEAAPPATPSPAAGGAQPDARAETCGLHNSPHERAIASDHSVAVVFATASALGSPTDRGDLLRSVLGRRGVAVVYIDEMHTVLPQSMGSYSAHLADLRHSLATIFALLSNHGHRRPQIVGLTSTLPPQLTREVKRRLGMAVTAKTVRCNIDRPELLYLRACLPQRPSEKAHRWVQRVLLWHTIHLPLWALDGGIVVFFATAKLARRAARVVQLPLPRHSGLRRNVVYLGTANQAASERRTNMVAFTVDRHAVLFTTETLSHGFGRALIHLVVNFDVGRSPTEFMQRNGRAARLHGESAVVSQVVDARLFVRRALFVDPAGGAVALAGILCVAQILAGRHCVRAKLLQSLGQHICTRPCRGCDACLGDGAAPHPAAVDAGPSDTRVRSLGDAPLQFEWVDASEAAAVLLAEGRLQLQSCLPDQPPPWGGGTTLTRLLATPAEHAPSPFHLSDAHNLLVWHLIAEDSIRYRTAAIPQRSHGAYLVCHADPFRTLEYQPNGRRRWLQVLVPLPDAPGTPDDVRFGDALHAPPAAFGRQKDRVPDPHRFPGSKRRRVAVHQHDVAVDGSDGLDDDDDDDDARVDRVLDGIAHNQFGNLTSEPPAPSSLATPSMHAGTTLQGLHSSVHDDDPRAVDDALVSAIPVDPTDPAAPDYISSLACRVRRHLLAAHEEADAAHRLMEVGLHLPQPLLRQFLSAVHLDASDLGLLQAGPT